MQLDVAPPFVLVKPVDGERDYYDLAVHGHHRPDHGSEFVAREIARRQRGRVNATSSCSMMKSEARGTRTATALPYFAGRRQRV